MWPFFDAFGDSWGSSGPSSKSFGALLDLFSGSLRRSRSHLKLQEPSGSENAIRHTSLNIRRLFSFWCICGMGNSVFRASKPVQEGPNIAQRRPKRATTSSGQPQDGPRDPQNGPKRPPRRPPEAPSDPPREAPKRPKGAPQTLSRGPQGLQEASLGGAKRLLAWGGGLVGCVYWRCAEHCYATNDCHGFFDFTRSPLISRNAFKSHVHNKGGTPVAPLWG